MKSTKKSLLASGLALLASVALLASTTFAWFTDSVTNSGNKIQAGRLKVDLLQLSDTLNDGQKAALGDALPTDGVYVSIADVKAPIFDYDLWEPGYTDFVALEVSNTGSLALKWKLELIANGAAGILGDVIDVYAKVSDSAITKPETFAAIQADGEYKLVGTLSELIADPDGAAYGVLYAAADADKPGPSAMYAGIALHMRETAGDDYQGESIGTTFDVVLKATQYTSETDGFGSSDYDQNAEFAADESWYDPEDTATQSYTLSTPEAVAGLSTLVASGNTFKGKTIELGADINLDGRKWDPIGSEAIPFQGTFDGNGKVITNMQANTTADGQYSGLFGKVTNAVVTDLTIRGGSVEATTGKTGALAGSSTGSTIQNVTVEGVTVHGKPSGDSYTGGLVGTGYTGKIKNCVVKDSTITGGNFIGGISGQGYASITGCTVDNCVIDGSYWKVGGIIGQLNEGTFTYQDLTVKNTTIRTGGDSAGGIVGFANYGDKTFNNCDVIDCTIERAGGSLTGAAGIVGQISSQSGNQFAFNNCEVTGLTFKAGSKISGVGGFVGNGYWRGFSGTTLTFTDCTSEIAAVDTDSVADAGAFVGDGQNNTYVFAGANQAVTTGTGITELIGKQGSSITITGEDTVAFTK